MADSRAPLAMGSAPEIATTELAVQPLVDESAGEFTPVTTGWIAWLVAALAGIALIGMLISDLGKGKPALWPMPAPRLMQK